MANFQLDGLSITTTRSFVSDKTPASYTDPSTGQLVGVPGTGHFVEQTDVSKFILENGTRSSLTTPGFNSKNKPLIIPPLSFSFTKTKKSATSYNHVYSVPTSYRDGPGALSYQDSSVWSTNVFQWGTGPSSISDLTDEVTRRATANLLKNLRGSSFNAAQAVAERAQTCNLVASTATRVAKALHSLKRGSFANAARDLGVMPAKRAGKRFNSQFAVDQGKAIGNAWLELQYGWKPLLSDVYGSMETLAKVTTAGNPNTIYQKASGSSRRTIESTTTQNYLTSGQTGVDKVIRYTKSYVNVRSGVLFSRSSPVLSSLASVGITNPILLGWELLPYSFVVDWFLPVGNYLESLDATLGLTFHSGYRTTFTRWTSHTSRDGDKSYNSGYTRNFGWAVEDYETVTTSRVTLAGFPSMPFPTFKNPLSTSHVASAMALLLQLKR